MSRDIQPFQPRRLEPQQGDILREIDTGLWWAYSGQGWVRVDGAEASLRRLRALVEKWEASDDPIFRAIAHEIRTKVGPFGKWVSSDDEEA